MTDKTIQRELYAAITKTELISIARDLGLVVAPTDRGVIIIDMILEDSAENGIPETEDMSPAMRKFYMTAKIIDKDGNILEEGEVEEPEEESKPEEPEEEKLPDCFGMVDEADPSCKRCKVVQRCKEQREKNLPECFGKLFDRQANECQICIVAGYCKDSMSKRG
jgi:hypothetical protein